MFMWRDWAVRQTAGVVLAGMAAAVVSASPAVAEPEAGRTIALGGSVIVKPKYEGSDEFEYIPIPIIIPRFSETPDEDPSTFKKFRKRVNFRGLDDIRIRALGSERLQLGAVTGYITNREQNDGDKLRGWGDVEGGLVLGGYAGFSVGAIQFDAAILDKVTGDESGFELRFGAETTQQLTERTTIVARVGTTFGSEDYMQTYFGITPQQSARSKADVPVYSADAGIKDVFLAIGGTVDLTDRWLLKAGGRYGRLVGEAADSPVVESENQLSGVLGLAYRFNLPR
ncbi:MAG TPA: MipA/OmpV family protein [Methyloceanibacter sp.]|nr:MipA/OmpV family protein [Methyloceanibacter sp.]